MRGRSHKAPEEASVDLTPMLDVVFILLIFFIVTSTFIQEEAIGLEPPPPPSPDQNQDQQQQAILVYVGEDNLITVNGRYTELAGVRANMERLRAENPDSALIIQAHPRAKTGTIVKIRDEAYNAKMTRVNIVQSEE
ncbi:MULTISPECIES: ExbD/TolR family protein [Henriciella]|jgi:biopolymer transport protein ExbD|uniref:Biopolymer transporter ExbD n=1 Tax=Henriciella pelagia TaxID=1977912 RepID=A0ABQ1J9M5_9PROT|nr:biopolymer transporter ExbD [Henriciella pelagia]GGB61988.1 biopolymer transporter ExbD [Henriciella pelagia]